MEMYSGSLIQVILAVKAARGFGFLRTPFIIEASLTNHILQSDAVQPSNDTIVGAELSWEAERKAVRRLRTGNVPVKVECFTFVNGKKHERLGYILLNLRTAQVIATNKLSSVSGIWHVLLGVNADLKPYRPELLLAFCIEDSSISEREPANMTVVISNSVPSNKYAPKLMKNEGLIQLGPLDSSSDIFLLTVLIEGAMHLNLLADSERDRGGKLYFSCNIMGFQVEAGSIPELSVFKSTAKVIMKIRSSLEILREYFSYSPPITVKVMAGDKELGFCDIEVNNLIPCGDLKLFCNEYANNNIVKTKSICYLIKSSEKDVPVSSEGMRPYINVALLLKCAQREESCKSGEGDAEDRISSSNSEQVLKATFTPQVLETTCTPPVEREQDDQEKEYEEEEESHFNDLHCVTVDVRVESILFYKLPPEKVFFFRFSHSRATVKPKAPTELTVDEVYKQVKLQDVGCTLTLEGPVEEIQRVLLGQAPRVLLCTSWIDSVPFAKGSVELGLLLVSKQKECQYTLELRGALDDTSYGVLQVSLKLEDSLTPKPRCVTSASAHGPVSSSVLDDRIAVKIVEELEEWKERQAEVFLMELKRKEQARLDTAMAAWEAQRKEFEQALNANVQRCSTLAATLSQAKEELQTERETVARKEEELTDLKKNLQAEYQLRLQECREASRRMEDDFRLEISKLEGEVARLNREVQILEEQNLALNEMVQSQQEQLNRGHKAALAEDQTVALLRELKTLQEKYEIAQRSKVFFKEQWARSVREVHCIKSKHSEELSSQIRAKREILQHLGLPAIEEEGERPGMMAGVSLGPQALPSGMELPRYVDAPQRRELLSVSSNADSVGRVSTASQQERLLQELVEERDSLLNTGSYALDHDIITHLNQQIRFLLTESGDKFL